MPLFADRSPQHSPRTVMAQTRERLRHADLRYQELAPSWDVDRPEDFERLHASGLMTEMGLDLSSADADIGSARVE